MRREYCTLVRKWDNVEEIVVVDEVRFFVGRGLGEGAGAGARARGGSGRPGKADAAGAARAAGTVAGGKRKMEQGGAEQHIPGPGEQ